MTDVLVNLRRVFSNAFLRFAGAGLVGTGAHYLSLIMLVHYSFMDPVAASVTGAVIGALINYCLSYWCVFKTKKKHSETLHKFMLIAAGAVGLNAIIMYGLVEVANFHYIVAQIMSSAATLIYGFIANSIWTFKQRGE